MSMVLLIRTWIKIKAGKTEKLIARNSELEKLVGQVELVNREREAAFSDKR